MTRIHTIVQDRRIDVPAPDDFPDGTEVVIDVLPARDKAGLDESQWDDSPAGIAAWLAWLDTLEPLTLTDQEVAQREADRQDRKQWEEERFAEHADQLAREWE